jgi:tellurite resistance protein TehA-like permease
MSPSECDIETSAMRSVMPTGLSSHELGNFNMQFSNVRHLAKMIETENSVYQLIQCIQMRMVYFYAVCGFSVRLA